MAQLLVRNLKPEVVEALKKRAASHGRSAEAEHKAILEAALSKDRDDFWALAAKLREDTRGRIKGESADLIREDRDSRDPGDRCVGRVEMGLGRTWAG